MGGSLRFAVVALFAALPLTAATPARADDCSAAAIGTDTVGDVVAACLVDGQTVELDGVTITGPITLSRHDIAAPFVCTSCYFIDHLDLRDTVFSGRVDLDGSTFDAAIDGTGAQFRQGLTLSLADNLSTSNAEMVFTGAEFGRALRAERLVGNGPVSFQAAVFGDDADFRGAAFHDSVDFTDARIGGNLDFQKTWFVGDIRLTAARIGGSFHAGATYEGEVRFAELEVAEAFKFDGARFTPDNPPEVDEENTCGQIVDFRDIEVGTFFFEGDDIDMICGPAIADEISELHETNARARGDLASANEARFIRLWRHGSMLDHIFYGGIAGYLVRWAHPAATLVILLLIGIGTRTWQKRRGPDRVGIGKSIVAGVKGTWSNFWPLLGSDRKRHPIEWVETLVAALIFFIGMYALSNSLPVVKEIIDNFV